MLFSTITLGASFLVFWGPLALFRIPGFGFVGEGRGPAWAIVPFIAGGFVPSLTAILLTRIREGRAGLTALLRSLLQFNLGLRWYVTIPGIIIFATAGQILIHNLLGNTFELRLFIVQLPSLIPLIVLGPLSEELGWRGYLLKRLQPRKHPLAASLVVGSVWAVWHLPLFYIPGTTQQSLQLPFFSYCAGVVALSVIMTWLHNRTGGSIWTAVFVHWLFTYAMQVVSSGVTRMPLYNRLEYSPYVVVAVAIGAGWAATRVRSMRGAAARDEQSGTALGRLPGT